MQASKSKLWAFRIIAILLPFLILGMLELVLRVGGFGQTSPLFIQNPQAPEYLLPKPDVVNRYFSKPEHGPNVTIETNFFLKQKPENGLRIFVQGGSTAAGFPYGFGASIAGMLDYRLKQTYPNKEVEVINTALSAVNSYTLLDFADEIIAQAPDAVVIYAGHNEFLGIMGVGSTYSTYNSRSANLLFLKLKDLRLFQLMQLAYDSVQKDSEAIAVAEKRQSRTVMAKVAKHKNIDIEHPLFSAGIEQFKQNMILLLDKYKQAGIPVFLSTIASNLSDQPPFESESLPDEYKDILQQPVESWSTVNELIIERQVQIQKGSAEAYFKLGKRYEYLGDYAKAKAAYENARQHDLLRFRAPLEINQVIRQLALDTNVTLVDAEAQLSAVAKNGIIGQALMLEHLHPTIKGYFEISDAFYNQIIESEALPKASNKVARFNAIQDLPIFDAEVYKGHAIIAGLKADYPFSAEPQISVLPPVRNEQERLGLKLHQQKISWLDVAQSSLKQAEKKGDTKSMVKAAKLISDAIPNNPEFAYQAGSMLIYTKQAEQSFRYLKRALRHKPNYINAQLALAHASAEINDYKQAEQWLLSVQKLEPNNSVVKQNLPELRKALRSQQN